LSGFIPASPESLAELQVRMHLERQCAELFLAVRSACDVRDCPFTLITFDYGPGGGPFENVAFKTNLDRAALARTAEALLESWELGQSREIPRDVWDKMRLPDSARIRAAGDFCRGVLPKSVGFAMIFGIAGWTSYISNGEREGVAGLLRELLPHWKAGT
jgi:hypothetical protein